MRDGKGARDRATMLAESLVQPLQEQLGRVRVQQEQPEKTSALLLDFLSRA